MKKKLFEIRKYYSIGKCNCRGFIVFRREFIHILYILRIPLFEKIYFSKDGGLSW